MTQQEINAIIADYNNGKTISYLIKEYHHRFSTIKQCLKQNNINVRSKCEAMQGKNRKKLSEEEKQIIINKYNNGEGARAIGKNYNCGDYAVKNILRDNNIKLRTQSESTQISNKNRKKYFCNENYFKYQNENMAYILGFLAADGTVALKSNEIKISVAEKDSDILNKIKKELEYTGKVKHTTNNKGFDIATLEITCAEYKKDLATFNIIPQKTFSFTIPQALEKRYYPDFIRGYWDGDGTICTAGAHAIRASLCGAVKETLQQILNYLEEEYAIPKVTIYCRNEKTSLYYFQYSTNATKKLFNVLYYKQNLLYLDRKYKKFCELCIDNKNPRDSISLE